MKSEKWLLNFLNTYAGFRTLASANSEQSVTSNMSLKSVVKLNVTKTKCLKRHPKKCRYHFLKRSCKFKESCEYSHGQEKEIQDIKLIRLEVEQLKKINKELENDLKALKLANVNLEVNLQNLTEEVDQVKKERDALESQNDSIKEVNDNLIEDLTTLNERLAFMIPGKLEEENLELKEKIAILKCISEMHDVEEIEEPIDEEIETIVESMETETDAYFC